MNFIETSINKVYSENALEDNPNYVRVNMQVGGYNNTHDTVKVFSESKWKEVKSKGYYLG